MKQTDLSMYYGASPNIFEKAKALRNDMTKAENILWEALKGKRLNGLRFRRQHPIDLFIVDFYCHEVRLVIEIDGEIHLKQVEYDIGRTAEMEKYNITVIRFSNQEVENSLDRVLSKIEETINKLKN